MCRLCELASRDLDDHVLTVFGRSHHSTIEAKDGEVHHQTDEESREAQVLPLAITPFDEVDQHAHLGPTWLDFFLDVRAADKCETHTEIYSSASSPRSTFSRQLMSSTTGHPSLLVRTALSPEAQKTDLVHRHGVHRRAGLAMAVDRQPRHTCARPFASRPHRSYRTGYQRNDWVHRGLKFLQLGVFACVVSLYIECSSQLAAPSAPSAIASM